MPRANPPPPANAASARMLSAEQIGQQLLRQFEHVRLQSLSLHKLDGELLWLSEGVFGPDEHGYVLDALDLFALESEQQQLERRLENGRRALFLCARTPRNECCGIALAILEERGARQFDASCAAVQTLMRSFSMLLAPARPIASTPPAPRAVPPATAPAPASSARPEPAARKTDLKARANPAAIHDKPSSAAAAPARAAATAASASPRAPKAAEKSRSPGTLDVGTAIHVRRYVRLRPGGTTRRFEVMASPVPSAQSDERLCARVLEHLQRMRDHYRHDPASICVPLSVQAVTDAHWLTQLQPTIRAAQLSAGTLGFCLPAMAWSQSTAPTAQFIERAGELGCFIALDDFTLMRPGFALLRSAALRCVKLDAQLIGALMQEKFAQASVAAIVQAARVLGLYVVAKQVESAALSQWLASAGIEFQDNFSPVETNAATRGEVLALERLS